MLKRHVNAHLLTLLITLRYILLCATSLLAMVLIPFSERFTFASIIETKNTPYLLGIWANFDGEHYLRIAREGYHGIERAFFPLYPLIIQSLSVLTGVSGIYIGFIVSQLFFITALWILLKFFKNKLGFMLILLAYPTSFYFSGVYTESLFLLLVALCLYLLQKKSKLVLSISLMLTALARIQGILIIIPVFFYLYSFKKGFVENIRGILFRNYLIYMPALGLSMYMLYLQATAGDALFFLHAQSSFGAHRSSELILLPQVIYRYIKIFYTAQFNYQYAIAALEFVVFLLAFAASCYHAITSFNKRHAPELGIALFSLANLLLPTLTGTFSSIPRYSLFALSIFYVAQRLPSKIQYLLMATCIVAQCVLFMFFTRGYFVS